jgi:hypothetical protein
MSIPPGLMGGGGAGQAPGLGGGNPMDALAQMQQSPQPQGEEQAMADASMKIGMALARIYMRSPKASRLLTEAAQKIQAAREALGEEGSRPISAPPNLAMAEQGMVPGMTM